MKTMRFWIEQSCSTLFLLALTTASNAQSINFIPPSNSISSPNAIEAPAPAPTPAAVPSPAPTPPPVKTTSERAFITSKMVSVLKEPRQGSLAILQLKQGDQVEVLSRADGFAKIRFRLEGDFPIEGFILEGAVANVTSTDSAPLNAQTQAYNDSERQTPSMEAKELPKTPMSEQVRPQIKPRALGPMASSSASVEESKPWVREGGPWIYEGHGFLGFTNMEESYTTKLPTSGAYADEPFLKYDMQGVTLAARGRIGYTWDKLEFGGYGSYDLTFFRGNVPTAVATFNPGINKTNVQALMHELKIGPYVRYPFQIAKGWSVIPELRILPSVVLFSTNQLKSVDNVNPGVPGQAVLYSTTTISAVAELAPQVTGPYDFSLTPKLGVTLFTSISEGQTVTSASGVPLAESDMLRTGSPTSPGMLFHYGATLAWNAKRLGAETINLAMTYAVTDSSKKYKGEGNRAGVKMLDTKSVGTNTFIGLGVEYLF